MTDDLNRADAPTDAPTANAANTGGRILTGPAIAALLLVAVVGGWAAYVYATGKDGFNWRRFTFQGEKQPEFVEVTGRITYNGQPLENGQLEAYSLDGDKKKRAVAKLGKDGGFKFLMHVNGDLTWGMYPGEYKLVVNATYPLQAGQLSPTKMLADKYYDKESSEVTLTVDADKSNTDQTIALKGDPVKPGPKQRSGPQGKKQPGGGRGFDPEQIINRIMESDKNGDKKISKEEAPDRLKRNFDEIDLNEDGLIDRKELETRFRKRRKKRAKTAGNGGQQ